MIPQERYQQALIQCPFCNKVWCVEFDSSAGSEPGDYPCAKCEAKIMAELDCKSQREHCDHYETDDHFHCMDCGKDLTEDRMAAAYDRWKEARKYGQS
jgi:DNA-directed RNA polymerase subunit RPC12/RpoP